MKEKDGFHWFLLCVLAYVTLVFAVFCVAPTNGAESALSGVLVQERVIDLPQDQDKWYLSIVGRKGGTRYEVILRWFDSNEKLMKLKDQVHFIEIESSTVIFNERYESNVKGLPTVRLQLSTGKVIYEAHGSNLPNSGDGLYGAIANSVNVAQGREIFPPWRRVSPCPDRRICPGPKPNPPAPPPVPDPEPQPIDDGGAPEMEEIESTESNFNTGSAGIGAGIAMLCFFSGCGASLFVQWRKAYGQK